MSKSKSPLKADVEDLLEKAVIEEATEAVWKVFEEVLAQVDESKLELLKDHFNGMNDQKLSSKSGISEIELNKILKHSKKEIVELMRREKSTRQ